MLEETIMKRAFDGPDNAQVIKGEFFTDGKTFIFRLADTPLSGIGATAEEAFANLIKAQSAADALSSRIRALALEQQDEKVRASLIRMIMVGLIALGVVGGALVTAAGMVPKITSDVSASMIAGLNSWLEELTPAREKKLDAVLHRVRTLLSDSKEECLTPRDSGPAAPSQAK
jgi:hypothetical protein